MREGHKLKYPDSWYVYFSPKFLSMFSVGYLVVLDKKSGAIQYTHDNNALAEFGKVVMTQTLEPAVASLSLISLYYGAKKEMPQNVEQLKEFIAQLPEDKRKGQEIFEGARIERITSKKIKLMYASHAQQNLASDDPLDFLKTFNMMDGYEMEIVMKDGKETIDIHGFKK